MKSAGSVWTKWDLHVHSPGSFHWTGKKFDSMNQEEKEKTCQEVFEKLNSLDIIAFCIMDYWTFDGYLELKKFADKNSSLFSKTLFPGIELRMEAPTNHKLNTHVLFSENVLPETLTHFLSNLRMAGLNKPPSRQNFVELGKSYDNGKLRTHGFTAEDKANEDKMLQLGLMTTIITRSSLEEAIKVVGEDNCLLIQPYDTSDGLEELDWKRHPYADSMLMKWAHIFETRDSLHVNLFLGHGHPNKSSVGNEFIQNLGGRPKPVVSGSDAHKISDYGKYPSDKITWLKARPTFRGLVQVCQEPSLRCFIGKIPPKLEHLHLNPTKYMKTISVAKTEGSTLEEKWFESVCIDLNPGLIAIIGNKGSGKSALADIIALCGNSQCTEMEFLTKSRFRGSGSRAKHFEATLTWSDETFSKINLDEDTNPFEPERIRYLPQKFIENLCNEIASGGNTKFEQELKEVIFSHVADEDRLQKNSLDELLDFQIAVHKRAIQQSQNKLSNLNEEIARIESEITPDSILRLKNELQLKESELSAHEANAPKQIEEPSVDANNNELKNVLTTVNSQMELAKSIQKEINSKKNAKQELASKDAALKRLIGEIEVLERYFENFKSEMLEIFEASNIEFDKVAKLIIDRTPIESAINSTKKQIIQIGLELDGGTAENQTGLFAKLEAIQNDIQKKQNELDAPQKRYQEYLLQFEDWKRRKAEIEGGPEKVGTINYIKEQILSATERLPLELSESKIEREEIVKEIHAGLTSIIEVYREIYYPVQKVASEHEFAKEVMQLEFNAYLDHSSFEENFLDYIRKNKRGNFFGDEESKRTVRELVAQCNFSDASGVVDFLNGVLKALTVIEKDGKTEEILIASQLKPSKKLNDLYDFIFGLSYLEPRYSLKLSEKDISQLSPGEKGALLLVFYLLLDKEETPIIIDQPEQNLDNESVVKLLVNCIRSARAKRQVIIVTHNPNLAVVCDADQIIYSYLDKTDGNLVTYESGAIEDEKINRQTVNVLEGTYPAFDNRRRKYHKQEPS